MEKVSAMKSAAFEYHRATTLNEAFACMARYDGQALWLAGGQSLLAMMNLRLANPPALIDIRGIAGLSEIRQTGSVVRIGALCTHKQLLDSAVIRQAVPLLAQAIPHVAHLAIRNVGTIGGSLALADPAAEYPTVVQALNGTLIAQGVAGERRIPVQDYFVGLYQTALQPGELLTAIELPVAQAGQHFHFDELSRRRGDYGMVGLACAGHLKGGTLSAVRLSFLAVGDGPVLARQSMAALEGKPLDAATIRHAQDLLQQDLQPAGDLQATAATKLHCARVLLGRALAAWSTAS
jgi:carbon-monoxide dehydrogenase medium subunit